MIEFAQSMDSNANPGEWLRQNLVLSTADGSRVKYDLDVDALLLTIKSDSIPSVVYEEGIPLSVLVLGEKKQDITIRFSNNNPEAKVQDEACSVYYNDVVLIGQKPMALNKALGHPIDLTALFNDPDGDPLLYTITFTGSVGGLNKQ